MERANNIIVFCDNIFKVSVSAGDQPSKVLRTSFVSQTVSYRGLESADLYIPFINLTTLGSSPTSFVEISETADLNEFSELYDDPSLNFLERNSIR